MYTVSCRLFEVPIIRNFNIFSHEFTRKYLSYQCRRNPGLRKRQKCVPANFSGSSFAWSTLVTNLIHYCVLKDPVFFYELRRGIRKNDLSEKSKPPGIFRLMGWWETRKSISLENFSDHTSSRSQNTCFFTVKLTVKNQ